MTRLVVVVLGLVLAVIAARVSPGYALFAASLVVSALILVATWSPGLRAKLAPTSWFKRGPKKTTGFPTKQLANLIATTEGLTGRINNVHIHPAKNVTVTITTNPDNTNLWREHADLLGTTVGMATPRITTTTTGLTLDYLPTARGRTPELAALKTWTTSPPPTVPNLRAVPVAHDAYGQTWTMPVLGSHALVIGATGAGKGSVLWSLVTQLAPAVETGLVKLWGADPKGGVEIGFGQDLFTVFVADTIDDAGESTWETDLAEALAEARRAMSERLTKMRGKTRLHTPTTDAPLVVMIIDEYLALTIGVQDKTLARQIEIDLKMILSQGRAAGFAVIALAQVAQKDVLGIVRDMFPVRVMLRIPDKVQVSMVLGPEALANGAAAHEIPDDMPGTAYVLQDGQVAPRLVRFPWVPDEQVQSMAREYAAPPKPVVQEHVRAPQLPPPTTMYQPAIEAIQESDPITAPLPVITPNMQQLPGLATVQTVTTPARQSKAEAIRTVLAEHPDWTPQQVADQTGATDRYVRQQMKLVTQPAK